ncbi:hypothetical protein HMI54_007329 [Coelomomyces lativittatus]|nr:hypothetical protein HMI56_001897 [Coelomomyces lativittatus]KAJ1504212.1 hypothetical protein HMI54_007329 [Coelomomyces lativittatus]KAJ1516528.1 hypothetical protein HMI55_002029 [Coelomomyces lativittatus]
MRIRPSTHLPSWIHQFQPSFFDPIYVCAQIIALQSAYYFIYSLLLCFMTLFSSSPLQLQWIFGMASYDWHFASSWGLMVVVWLNACIGCFSVLVLIQKSKQVLDFVVTLHVFHGLITWGYNQTFPWSFGWYLAYLGSLCIMVLGGERVCIQRETTPIVFNMNPLSSSSSSSSSSTSSSSSSSSSSTSISRWFSWRSSKRAHGSDENIQLNQTTTTGFHRSNSSTTLR